MRELRGGHQGGVLDAHAVMQFVTLAEAAQDGNGVFDTRLIDHHRLETTFQRGVFLDVFAIFVERGGADAMQFAAGEHRLEHVAGVHGPFGLACADHGVDFVNEQDDLPLGASDFLEHSFEAFLEFAAILRSGDERAKVEPDQTFVLEAVRHVAGDDPAGQPLDDGRLAHTRFADEDRVVLGAARKDLDAAADLGVPADDGVQFVLLRQFREVASVFFQGLVSGFGIGAGDALVAAHVGERPENFIATDIERLENLAHAGGGRLVEDGQHQVLDADVFVFQFLRFVLGFDQELVQPLGDVNTLAGHVAAGDARNPIEFLLDFSLEQIRRDLGLLEQARHESAFLLQQREHEVLDIHGLVLVARRDVLRLHQSALGFFGELVEVHGHTRVLYNLSKRQQANANAELAGRISTVPQSGGWKAAGTRTLEIVRLT